MLFVTTTSGIFVIDQGNISKLCDSEIGFFGIDRYNDCIIVAERTILRSSNNISKQSSDVSLYIIDNNINMYKYDDIYDVSDVHQIAVDSNFLYLTNTGQNCIVVYDLLAKNVLWYIVVDSYGIDKNHINALHIDENYIYIGMKNLPGHKSEIAIFNKSLTDIIQEELVFGTLHDIEPLSIDCLLMCDSHKGIIYKYPEQKPFINTNRKWTRGLATSDNEIYVGFSHVGERHQRYCKHLNGMIGIYDYDGNHKDNIVVPYCGQIYDLFYWDEICKN